jgi:hypothetical protein
MRKKIIRSFLLASSIMYFANAIVAEETLKLEIPKNEFLSKKGSALVGNLKLKVPVLKTFDGEKEVASFGYIFKDNINFLVFKLSSKDKSNAIIGVYVNTDNDLETGRKKVGNEFYIAPPKDVLYIYGKKKEAKVKPELNYLTNGCLVLGILQKNMPKLPAESSIVINTTDGKIGRFWLFSSKPSEKKSHSKKTKLIDFANPTKEEYAKSIPVFKKEFSKNILAESSFLKDIDEELGKKKWRVNNGQAKILNGKGANEQNAAQLISSAYPSDVRISQVVDIVKSGNYKLTAFVKNPGGACRFYVKYEISGANKKYLSGYRSEIMIIPPGDKWIQFSYSKYINVGKPLELEVYLRAVTEDDILISSPELKIVKPDKIYISETEPEASLMQETTNVFFWTAPPLKILAGIKKCHII